MDGLCHCIRNGLGYGHVDKVGMDFIGDRVGDRDGVGDGHIDRVGDRVRDGNCVRLMRTSRCTRPPRAHLRP